MVFTSLERADIPVILFPTAAIYTNVGPMEYTIVITRMTREVFIGMECFIHPRTAAKKIRRISLATRN